jgi:hypothetical protein
VVVQSPGIVAWILCTLWRRVMYFRRGTMNGDPASFDGELETTGRRTATAARGRAAVDAWVRRGTAAPLARWLGQALDGQGIPLRLAVAAWADVLALMDEARRDRPEGWPDTLDAPIEALLLATIRFTRATGAAVFTDPEEPHDATRAALYRLWAARLSEPGLTTVLDRWFPPPRGREPRRRGRRRVPAPAPPPLPAWSSAQRPLAILRANWSEHGDFLAIDHRRPGSTSLVELTGLGQVWLGPTWAADDPLAQSGLADGRSSPPRLRTWLTNSAADLAEWSFRSRGARVTRTVLLLRGRRIALLADQVDGVRPGAPASAGWHIAVPPGVESAPTTGTTAWTLAPRRGSPRARLVPLALPCLGGTPDRGTFTRAGRTLHLSQPCRGRRAWLPVLASWDPIRNRQAIHWRMLTVAENSRVCPPDRAFAARVTWGRSETLVIYRSLGPPALRSLLGHQTRARMLVALFGSDGTVTPILTLD